MSCCMINEKFITSVNNVPSHLSSAAVSKDREISSFTLFLNGIVFRVCRRAKFVHCQSLLVPKERGSIWKVEGEMGSIHSLIWDVISLFLPEVFKAPF